LAVTIRAGAYEHLMRLEHVLWGLDQPKRQPFRLPEGGSAALEHLLRSTVKQVIAISHLHW